MPESVKRERLERLTELQRADHRRAVRAARRPDGARDGRSRRRRDGRARGRTVWQADDIDGVTHVRGSGWRPDRSSTCDRSRMSWTTTTSSRGSLRACRSRAGDARAARTRSVAARNGSAIDRQLRTVSTALRRRSWRARATLFPGGVNSPVRAFGGVGGEPFVVARGEGRAHLGRRRQRVHRLRALVGAARPRPRARRSVLDALDETMRRGTSFGIPDGARGRARRADHASGCRTSR